MKTAWYSLVKVGFSRAHPVRENRQQMKSVVPDRKALRLDMLAPLPGDLTHKMRGLFW
jgi:hypothetical protein